MGAWDKFKENILTPIRKKFKEYGERFQNFQDNNPKFKAVWSFLTHPTMTRIYVIVGSLAIAPFTGGFSLLVAAKVGITFGTSLISIAAKAIQLRNSRKLKYQRGLANAILEKHAKLTALKDKRKRLFTVLQKNEPSSKPYEIDSKIESRFMSFLKTIRDFGAENILPTAAMAFTSPGAALGYVVGVAGGALFMSGEFNERVALKHNNAHIKDSIRGACKIAGIPQYKNSAELYRIFQDKMIEYEATQQICKIFDDNPQMSDKEILSTYKEIENEVKNTIKFENIPPQPNFLKSIWDEVRPWGKKKISYELSDKEIITYQAPQTTPRVSKIQLGKLYPSKSPSVTKPKEKIR